MENVINDKRLYIADIIDFLANNPYYAAGIIADLPNHVAHCVRYVLLGEFKKACESEGINYSHLKAEHVPMILAGILECWCCHKPLNLCLTLIEEGWTILKHETDPYIFDRAEAMAMTYLDEKGIKRILSCGFSYS